MTRGGNLVFFAELLGKAIMINLSQETITLARRLAAAQGISIEDAIAQAVEQRAQESGVTATYEQGRQRDVSPSAVAARKARMDRIVNEIAALPVLDPRSPREIMDDLNAL